jgi:hypothetical protein
MAMSTFTCIKPACANTYESNEQEAYYCPDCVAANKAIAAQIDAQIASRPSKRGGTSAWQEYEAAQKMRTGGIQGVHIRL